MRRCVELSIFTLWQPWIPDIFNNTHLRYTLSPSRRLMDTYKTLLCYQGNETSRSGTSGPSRYNTTSTFISATGIIHTIQHALYQCIPFLDPMSMSLMHALNLFLYIWLWMPQKIAVHWICPLCDCLLASTLIDMITGMGFQLSFSFQPGSGREKCDSTTVSFILAGTDSLDYLSFSSPSPHALASFAQIRVPEPSIYVMVNHLTLNNDTHTAGMAL